jgi:predicted MFS family arabinose efflux permease
MASSLTNLISMGLAGWIAGVVGLRETFVLAGAIVLVAGITMGWMLKDDKNIHSVQENNQQERGRVQTQEVLAGD